MEDEAIAADRTTNPGSVYHTPQLNIAWHSGWQELVENLQVAVSPAHLVGDAAGTVPFSTAPARLRRHKITGAQALSLAVHGLLVCALLFPWLNGEIQLRPPRPGDWGPLIYVRPPETKRAPVREQTGGGSGGERNPVPATRGNLPPFSWLQITPPMLRPPADAKLQVAATVVGPPELTVPDPLQMLGDPRALSVTGSAGPGERGGIGDKCCGGIGPGKGRGAGEGQDWGAGNPGQPRAGTRGASYPVCAYCPNPPYADEARKSKQQGKVILHVIVEADGRVGEIRLVQGIGFGLDERAIEAVRGWQFKPALGPGGKPMAVWVPVEVTFRLL
jgi:protein TonB